MQITEKKYKSIIIIQRFIRRYLVKLYIYELLRDRCLDETKQWFPQIYGTILYNRKDKEKDNYKAL